MSFENVNWSDFFQAYTGLQFSIKNSDCKIFVPQYANINSSLVPSSSGSEMVFKDEWSSQTFLATPGSTEKINGIKLQQLYQYAQDNIIWDEFAQTVSFQDTEVNKVTLFDFVKDLETFLVYHKLTKFGNLWWAARASTDFEGIDNSNVFIKDVIAPVTDLNRDGAVNSEDLDIVNLTFGSTTLSPLYNKQYDIDSNGVINTVEYDQVTADAAANKTTSFSEVKFWSPDKYINDEFKKYFSNPSAYNGFLTGDDFSSNGWFTVPDLKLSTKPFEKLKFAYILLNINFTFDPRHFGKYYTIDSRVSARIKDLTSGQIFDSSLGGSGQNNVFYNDSLIANWAGGLVSTENLQTVGEVGTFKTDKCTNPTEPEPLPTEISHSIAGQLSLNIEYDSVVKDILGTIDAINWKSSEQADNAHHIGILSVDRAFGGASGTIDGGIVFGGIQTQRTEGRSINYPSMLNSVEIWSGDKFLTNVQASATTNRSFHLQGGFGSKSAVIVGGYGAFNTETQEQYAEYSKTDVKGNMEVFIKADDPLLSYFITVPNFALNVSRGDASGVLTVAIEDRKDKFEAVDVLKNFNVGKDQEQTIAEFINTQSSTDNFKRYSVLNIKGFIYGGNSSGKSYLTSVASSDILDSFERINTVFIDSGISDDAALNPTLLSDPDACTDGVKTVLTIGSAQQEGVTVDLEQCGRYKITYLNGAGTSGPQVIQAGNKKIFGSVYSLGGGNSDTLAAGVLGTTTASQIARAFRNISGFGLFGGSGFGSWVKKKVKKASSAVSSAVSSVGSAIRSIGLPGLPGVEEIGLYFATGGLSSLLPVLSGLASLPGLPNIFGNSGSGVVGNQTTTVVTYSPTLRVYVNEQKEETLAFNVPVQGTQKEVEEYFKSNPTKKEYIFCCEQPDSVLRLIFNDIDFKDNSGYINVSVCFIGVNSDCGCVDTSEQAATNIAVHYSRVEPSLKYPVSCHGQKYVGTDTHGISTGGRCELSSISENEARLIEKYKTPYRVDYIRTETTSDFIKSRILDLVYQYDGTTWIRKQNLIDSVYHHCGVGDESNAIFWGGIHDSLSNFYFQGSIKTDTPSAADYSDWGCVNTRLIKTESDVTLEGVNYDKTQVSASTCWPSSNKEIWEVAGFGTDAKLFSDPSYVGTTTENLLQYATDPNFPTTRIISLYPQGIVTSTASVTGSPYLNISYPSTNSLSISASFISGNTFNVRAITDEGVRGTFTGKWELDDISLNWENTTTIYPSDISSGPSGISSISNRSSILKIVELFGSSDSVDITYRFEDQFKYITTTDLTPPFTRKAHALRGIGVMSFNSLDSMWKNGVIPGERIVADNNTMLIVTTASEVSGSFYATGTANILASMTVASGGVMVGVKGDSLEWVSSLEQCGSDQLFDMTEVQTRFTDDYETWGVPMWSAAFNTGVDLALNYNFNVRSEVSSGNVGFIDHEITSLELESKSLLSLLSNRVLIKGQTKEQEHHYVGINDSVIPTVTGGINDCQNPYPATLQVVYSLGVPPTGASYTEWASSFIQEYRANAPYRVPNKWVPSNGWNIVPEIDGSNYKGSSWKRYMDNTGLGGFVPDYDSIYDIQNGRRTPVENWKELETWHVGQMAFGTPQRAVIVGGHKLNKTLGNYGDTIGTVQRLDPDRQAIVGLHTGETTKRVFIWDYSSIPPEDSYSKNYFGRRFNTTFDTTSHLSSNENVSDLNCMIFNAESDIVVERHGVAEFDGSAATVKVEFDKPLPDDVGATYSISMSPDDNIKLWWSDKSTTGFTINSEIKDWVGKVDYMITTVIKVKEEDITQKDVLDGYTFDK